MATYSSILAWEIPGTVEPVGLHSRVAKRWERLSDFHFHVLKLPQPESLRSYPYCFYRFCNTKCFGTLGVSSISITNIRDEF